MIDLRIARAARHADDPARSREDRPARSPWKRTRGSAAGAPSSSSIVPEELFWDLDGPIVRITTPHVPLAAANNLEDEQIPNADKIVAGVRQLVD